MENDESDPEDFSLFSKNNHNSDKNDENNMNYIEDKMGNLNVENEPNKKKKMIPREYQKQIYEKAKEENSIIYAETGRGKTFIAIMLMANCLGIDLQSEKKQNIDKTKKIIFFVCNTSLVNQQKKEISDALNIEVGIFQGRKGKKKNKNYESFKREWDSLNIFVAMPSVIYNYLSRGYITIFDISMLIFDECHHTADEHVYNKIMNEFYFYYKKEENNQKYKFPRIYGLTASPKKNTIKNGSLEANAIESLENLCENLDCVVVIDPEIVNSNTEGIRPGETVKQYLNEDIYIEVKSHVENNEYKYIFKDLYNECFYDFMTISFSSLIKNYSEYSGKDYQEEYSKYLKKKFNSENLEEYNKVTQTFSQLYKLRQYSPFFAIFERLQRDLFLILGNLCIDSLIAYFQELNKSYNIIYQNKKIEEKNKEKNKEKNEGKNQENDDNNFLNKSSSSLNSFENEEEDDDEEDVLSLQADSIKELNDIYLKIIEKLKETKVQHNYVSDILQKLFYKIEDLFKQNDSNKLIIFIANRIVAHFLSPSLNTFLRQKFKNKKCEEIIGINKKRSGGGTSLTPSITQIKMNEIIKKFNEDKFNILIGTSAIEEGLDIQSCNAVLTLVELTTPKSFIQIKGRARKSNSNFLIFTNSAINSKIRVENYIELGKKMTNLFLYNIKRDFRRPNYIQKKADFFSYEDPKTHSKVTFGNVSMFYNEIQMQINSSGFKFKSSITIQKVKCGNGLQEFEYIGEIQLSTNLEGVQKKFPYRTRKQKKIENAKKQCQIQVILILKKLKYLDGYLRFCKKK